MQTILTDSLQFGNNIVTQHDLRELIATKVLGRAHRKFQQTLIESLDAGQAVEPGMLSAQLLYMPMDWSLQSIKGSITRKEHELLLSYVPRCEKLFVQVREARPSYTREESNQRLTTPNQILQRDLRNYLKLVEAIQVQSSNRDWILAAISKGAAVEAGLLTLRIDFRSIRQTSRSIAEQILGPERCSEIAEAISPVYRRRLVITDSQGQPLGWHADDPEIQYALAASSPANLRRAAK